MNQYKYTAEGLYAATDDGLAIIHKYLPQSIGCERSTRYKFKLREEKTASCVLFPGENYWFVKDFGSDEVFTPIQVVQMVSGYTNFYETLQMLYAEFSVLENNVHIPKNITFKDKGDLPEGYFKLYPKPKVENPTAFSRFVTPEICQKYNVYEIEKIERVIKDNKLLIIQGSATYPIFAYSDNLEVWAKTYFPSEKKREWFDEKTLQRKSQNYKHGYIGKKPEKYVHGLTRIDQEYNRRYRENTDRILMENEGANPDALYKKVEEASKLEYVFICSGGSDGLSLASLSDDFFPIWMNSEAERIDYDVYNDLKKICKNLINIPDVDASGMNYAYKYSKQYWKLQTLILHKDLLKTEKNGVVKYGKDFRDFLAHFPTQSKEIIAKEFLKLTKSTVCCDFIMVKDKKYAVNVENLRYFLNSENFFGFTPEFSPETKNNETSDFLIQIDEFKVKQPTSKEVREHCRQYFIRKGESIEKINLINTTNYLRAADLANTPLRSEALNFTDSGEDFQLFFFQNTAVRVKANKIENVQKENVFVWEKNIIENEFMLEKKSFFEIFTDENNNKRVKINEKHCDFMNFIINTSRVHWGVEYLADTENFRNNFTLNSPKLTIEQQITQESHFLGKCYAIGYLLHHFKLRGYEKFVYIVDDKIKEEISENNGRSGKGLLMQGVSKLAPYFYRNGKDKNLFSNPHLLGDYRGEKLLFFDDILDNEATHKFDNFYSLITDGITVNPKNLGSYYIPYEKAPKIVGTYNHALRNPTNSTLGRILFVLFSDYYHYTSAEHKEPHTPKDDFKNAFFQQWDRVQWNLFYNFMLQCLQLYFQNIKEPLLSPSENLHINSLKASMGDGFIEWADGFFTEDKLNTDLVRSDIFYEYKTIAGKYACTNQRFKKNIEIYCELNGYILNPPDKCNLRADGRYTKRQHYPDYSSKIVEFFHIQAIKQEEPVKQHQNYNNTTTQHNTTNTDDFSDVPF